MAATTSDKKARLKAFERSFTFKEHAIRAVYIRKSEGEGLTTSTSLADYLKALDVPSEVNRDQKHFPSFDDDRWTVYCQISSKKIEQADQLAVRLRMTKKAWEVGPACIRQVAFNIKLLSPESRTPIKASASSAIRLYDSTDTTWGWDAFVPMAKLREDPEIKSKGAFIIAYEVTEYADSSMWEGLASPTVDYKGLALAMHRMSGKKPDVRFIFPGGDSLYGHAAVLARQSQYLKKLLTSGALETLLRARDEASAGVERSEPAYQDSDFGDVECDADELMEDASSSETTEMIEDIQPVEQDWLANEKMKTVVVADFSSKTFSAYLLWLQTGAIQFSSLQSSMVSNNNVEKQSDDQMPEASPKSIYRLADKYDSIDLKALARQRLLAAITPSNVLRELAHDFASIFPEFAELYKAYALKHWNEVKQTEGFSDSLSILLKREHTKKVILDILQKTTIVNDQ